MSESILEEAQRLIHGQRNKDYGHPRDNITHTANIWSAYLGIEITALDVCHMMQQLKQSRMKTTGEYHRDSVVDIAGYAGVAERVYEEPKLGELTPEKTGEPRQWHDVKDVPSGVVVKDRDGDIWKWEGDRRHIWTDGEGWDDGVVRDARSQSLPHYAPYVELPRL